MYVYINIYIIIHVFIFIYVYAYIHIYALYATVGSLRERRTRSITSKGDIAIFVYYNDNNDVDIYLNRQFNDYVN
jgi:hypothetical protein